MDFNSLMQQAKKIQEEMEKQQQKLEAREYRSTVAKSIAEVVMDGGYQVLEVNINKEFAENFSAEDKEILEDSLILALNELTNKISEDKEEGLGSLAGNMNIPGLDL